MVSVFLFKETCKLLLQAVYHNIVGHLDLFEVKQSLITLKTDLFFSPEQFPRAIPSPFICSNYT